jgi:hypothetical protein
MATVLHRSLRQAAPVSLAVSQRPGHRRTVAATGDGRRTGKSPLPKTCHELIGSLTAGVGYSPL